MKVGDQVKFACVDGPEFDGHQIDFNDLMMRLKRYAEDERAALDHWPAELSCERAGVIRGCKRSRTARGKSIRPQLREPRWRGRRRQFGRFLSSALRCASRTHWQRATNFDEVACGFSLDDALLEAERCLLCPEQPCVAGCPVGNDIPGFIQRLTEKDYRGAYDVLTSDQLDARHLRSRLPTGNAVRGSLHRRRHARASGDRTTGTLGR